MTRPKRRNKNIGVNDNFKYKGGILYNTKLNKKTYFILCARFTIKSGLTMPIQTTRAVPRAICTDGDRCRIAISRLPDVANVSQDGVGPSTQHNQAMARNQSSWE